VSISRHVEAAAPNGKMTLADLREFVAELDKAGAADTTVIKGRVNFGGTVRSLSADAVRFGDAGSAEAQ
jgi:hypothetical protein